MCGEKIIIAEHNSIQSCLQSCTVFTRYYWRTNEQTSFAWRISFRQIITHNFNSNHYKNTNFTGLRCLSINEHIYSVYQTAKGSSFQAILRKNHVPSVITQPHRPNQNPAETVIRELRKRWYQAIFRTNCPRAVWNYGLPHFAKLMQLTASNAASLNGQTPLEVITGETPDISQYLDFGWYDWVWYKENAGLDVRLLG